MTNKFKSIQVIFVIFSIMCINMANAQKLVDPKLASQNLANIYNTKFIDANGVYFQIQSNNDVSGVSGCNNFAGRVQINLDTKEIKFLQLASTRKFCDDKANQIEADFFVNIYKITKFTYNKNLQTMELTDDNNNIMLIFKKIKNNNKIPRS